MAPVTISSGVAAGHGEPAMGIGHVSTTADPRQSFLPAVLNLGPPSTLIFFIFLLLFVSIFFRSRFSTRLIGTPLLTKASLRRAESQIALAEGGFGLEAKSRASHPEDVGTSPPDSTLGKSPKTLYKPPAIMAQDDNSSTPSVLRPQARKPRPHSGLASTVSLSQGRYTGVLLGPSPSLPRAVEAWRGIPYAQSTAGENRFRPPVPLPPDAGTSVQADTFGQICPGTVARVSGIAEGEDCLNLNVYRPINWQNDLSKEASGYMPVIVYVHGGAFNGGMGTERDMASFVGWADTPVLGINFNYRVGALGFPSCVVADREGCLNLGLRDQQMLFGWVRDNVGAFGGDSRRVTIMGLSAGAHSIGYHLQSYTYSEAPFHAAILESGGATARATLSPSHPRTEAQWREFLLALDIQMSSVRPEQLFALLRSLSLDSILRASNAVFARYQDPIRWPFQPVIESSKENGGVITDLPINSFRRGKFLKIPILSGFNTNEGAVFCHPHVSTNTDFLTKFITMIPALTQPDLVSLSTLYPDPVTFPTSPYSRVPQGFGRQWARYEAAYAHYAYICPVLQTGHFYSEHWYEETAKGGQGEQEPPVWIYQFAPLSRPELGGAANHGDEAPVVAHDMTAIGAHPGLVKTSAAMHGAWVRFIATGDPNPSSSEASSGTPFWPRFNSPFIGDTDASPGQLRRKGRANADRHGRIMMFGSGNDERLGDQGRRRMGTPANVVRLSETETEKCRYWWERVELSEGMGLRLGGGSARL